MAIRQNFIQYVYGVGDNLIQLPPQPIVANRDPSSADFAQPGTVWINSSDDTIWMLATITANSANWQTSPASGVGIFSSVQVTTGDLDVDQGDVNITLGNLNVDAGDTTLAGALTVSGTATFNGDIDFASASLIDFTSTLDAAPSILLEANGGTSEGIQLRSNQGTSVSSIYLLSDVGGLTLRAAGLASADAINLEAPLGGIDMDAALQINIASSRNTADAIVLSASAGGIDILAAGAAAEDIDIVNTAGSVNITGGEAAADAVVISASNAAGGISVAAGTAGISVVATNGVVDIVSGTGAISISDDAAATAVNIGTGAAAKTVIVGSTDTTSTTTIQSGSGGVLVTSSDEVLVDCAGLLELNSSAGAIGIGNDAVAQNINIGTGAAARVVTIGNVTGASQVVLNSGTAGVAINTTGTGDVVVTSADTVLIDAAGVLELNSSAGVIGIGNDAVAQNINIGTGAAARTITVGNATGASSVVVNVGTGALNLGTNATAHATAIGSTTAASTLTLNTPTGTNVLAAEGLSVTTAGRGVSLPGGLLVLSGAGSPDTLVTAPAGSMYLRSDPAGAASRIYVNTDSATAWTNVTCAA